MRDAVITRSARPMLSRVRLVTLVRYFRPVVASVCRSRDCSETRQKYKCIDKVREGERKREFHERIAKLGRKRKIISPARSRPGEREGQRRSCNRCLLDRGLFTLCIRPSYLESHGLSRVYKRAVPSVSAVHLDSVYTSQREAKRRRRRQ